MNPIQLRPELAAEVSAVAEADGQSIEALVEAVLAQHVREWREAQLDREEAAYAAQKATLLPRYEGRFIAMYQGQVIDDDAALVALHDRVLARLGRAVVLLKKVRRGPEPVRRLGSPRKEREGS